MIFLKEKYRKKDESTSQKIEEAFAFKNKTAPYIINDANYWLFGELPEDIPEGYYDDPHVMFEYQIKKIERHYNTAQYKNDCYYGFLMPWFGTGVLASGFGTPVEFLPKMDPAVNMSSIKDPEEIDALVLPNPDTDGLMPRVLKQIDFFKANCDLPIGVTDCQGPLTTALSIIGYENYMYWMYDCPDKIHHLMDLCTNALIGWVKIQKQLAGAKDKDPGFIIGAKMPEGYGGVWIADDDSVIMPEDLFREFVKPYNEKVMLAFGGGGIHYCGCSNQNTDNYLSTKGLNCLHNLHLDSFEQVKLVRNACLDSGKVFYLSDFVPSDERIDDYFETVYGKMAQQGMIVSSYIAPAIALISGKYEAIQRSQYELGKLVSSVIEEKQKKIFLMRRI